MTTECLNCHGIKADDCGCCVDGLQTPTQRAETEAYYGLDCDQPEGDVEAVLPNARHDADADAYDRYQDDRYERMMDEDARNPYHPGTLIRRNER